MFRMWRATALSVMSLCILGISVSAQKPKATPAPKTSKSAIFAVLGDGSTLEPIAFVSKGKLSAPVNGSDDEKLITAFNKTYYKPGTTYKLIFGSASSGTVSVKKSDPKAECSRNMATVTTSAAKTPLKGLVMGLATNAPVKWTAASYRRRPTADERTEIEKLVRAEYLKHKLTATTLKSQNLTAIDVDHDGDAEMVGTYWIDVDKLTRALLFFIASKDAKGKYAVGYREYRSIDQANVMSGEIKSVDDGVYHELLLDSFDYDGDGTAEIFTYSQSFEGAGFNAYRRKGNTWTRAYEFANYHCGY